MSTLVIAALFVGSVAAILAVGMIAARLVTRRGDLKTNDPASPWPQPSLQRIEEQTKLRPPGTGPVATPGFTGVGPIAGADGGGGGGDP